jgi:predicted MFS family arabinose efflux permease
MMGPGVSAADTRAEAGNAVALVLAFAFAYFLSALLRAVTATLAPVFSAELGLQPADLGLLAGVYFLGFASLQLPLGRALDRFGPRRVQLVLLSVAVVGCAAFSQARGLLSLSAARLLIGMGVAACLMAPLTCYRHVFGASTQLRLNSWMLMTGSLGMLASTLPVQMLLPHWGWRGLFMVLAVSLLLAMGLIARFAPRARPAMAQGDVARYRDIMRHPMFVAMAPLGFFSYGGLIAVQSLWAGPWLTQVTGRSAAQAAEGLFAVNLSMLVAFMAWGMVMPRLARAGLQAAHLIAWGLPVSLLVLVLIVALGTAAGAWHWASWCVLCTCVSLSQPAVAQAFPPAWAGRALSAFNLVIFGGVFCLQWGIGLAIDALGAAGWTRVASFQGAIGLFALGCLLAYAWFLWRQRRMVIISAEAAYR